MTPSAGLPGWERLRHGGLLLDGARLEAVSRHGNAPAPLDAYTVGKLRQRAGAMLDGARAGSGDGGESGGSGAGSGSESGDRGDSGDNGDSGASSFVAFVLEQVCGFDASTGMWARGSNVAPAEGRRAVTGETVKPRHLWTGRRGARLPVFLDGGKRLGVGRGRRIVSQVLGWLRAGGDHLALVTNGRQWRLVFAGLDHDAWCEWDLDLWFEEGALSPQVAVLRTLLRPELWTPPSEGAAGEGPPSEGPTGTDPGGTGPGGTGPAPPPPLLQCIRDTRKGQAELSEVLGERVREAVELLIRGHGEALKAHCASVAPADVYRAACRVAMRLVVILFAESRDLLPRDNVVYHESYGLNGLLEGLERAAARGGAPAAGGIGAWSRVLALFRLVREGSHHPDLPVAAYGGDLFAPGAFGAETAGDAGLRIRKDALAPGISGAETARDAGTSASRPVGSLGGGAADGLSQALAVFESACFESGAEVMPDRDVHEVLTLLTRTTIRIRQGRGGVRAVVPVDFSDLSSEYIGILYEGLLDYELKTAPPGDPVIFLSVGDQPALPLSRLEAMDERALKALFESLKEDRSTAADTGDAASDVDTGDTADGVDAAGVAEDLTEGDAAVGAEDLPEEDGGEPAGREPEPPEASGKATRSRAGTEGGAPPPDDALPPGVRAGVREAAPEYLAPASGSASGLALEPAPGPDARAAAPEYLAPPVGAASDLALEPAPGPEPRAATPEYLAPPPGSDERQRNRTRAERWARRAAQAAGLVRKPRGRDNPERRLAFDAQVGAKARQLVARVVLPGEWYLVRWGGTRKGSGSFYTRPGLAVPTVQRTLRPLAFDPPPGAGGAPDRDAPPARWTPKLPERILDVKVCDPACGSGTFPLAALRFLTDALYASLQHHGRIEADGERALIRLLGIRGGEATGGEAMDGDAEGGEAAGGEAGVDGETATAGNGPVPATPGPRLGDELIPCRPDDDTFESRLKAVLRRHVVERCLYAVDLDPLAVELCRLSLWIETMDRTLPFGFLDHKIKCGNALIGAWFDRFPHYPAMAWKNREGGDRNHGNGVHFEKNARTKAIKAFVKDRLTPDLKLFLHGPDLFAGDLLRKAATAHDDALAALADMHALPVQDAAERARIYRERFLESPAWRALKAAMDLWCACWFWPAEEIEHAPLPTAFADPPPGTRAVAGRIAAEMRFFHWELEFPDVFREAGSGFDAILGNPPWDIAKPVSKEFFSDVDPLYRSYGKQEALRRQSEYFEDRTVERAWLDYNARFRAQSNFMGHVASPFGDPGENPKSQDRFSVVRGRENARLHERWRQARARSRGFGDPAHPFRHQGSADLNLYKLFLEAAHALLKHPRRIGGPDGAEGAEGADVAGGAGDVAGGRLGFVVPSGLYSDNGTGALRELFIERCRWEWLFGIENRDKVFPIHRSYKFNPVIIEKGGATEAIRTAFMRRNVDDWERAEGLATPYTRAQVERFSPKSRAILEIQSKRDLEILEKIYANAVLLGDDGPEGWGIRYATEFHMTNDSRLFPPRPQWEAKGYRPDEYSRWLLGEWRPIEELWATLGVDPARPEPAEIVLEDWLFDTTAGPERRTAEARFAHGHLLKPGDVARTDWRLRCAQPPYDRLPVPRARVPAGIVLSREGDAWIRDQDCVFPPNPNRNAGGGPHESDRNEPPAEMHVGTKRLEAREPREGPGPFGSGVSRGGTGVPPTSVVPAASAGAGSAISVPSFPITPAEAEGKRESMLPENGMSPGNAGVRGRNSRPATDRRSGTEGPPEPEPENMGVSPASTQTGVSREATVTGLPGSGEPPPVLPESTPQARASSSEEGVEGIEGMALPVYAGKMIYVGNWAASPAGDDLPGRIDLAPDFLLGADDLRHDPRAGSRVVFRDISNSTNERSFVSALLPGLFPCGNKTPVLDLPSHDLTREIELGALVTSLVFDWAVRQRMSGTTLNWHIVESLALPNPGSGADDLNVQATRVFLSGIQFAGEWLRLSRSSLSRTLSRPTLHAPTPHERLRIVAMIDAVVAAVMRLSMPDLRHILAECDHPCGATGDKQPKGFWRVDRDKDPELRHTALTLIAFHDLQAKIEAAGGDRGQGIEAFLSQNDGEGWMLPETLRLADYGLGHDERARHPQPVAGRIGPRFHDWQLARSTEESWRECHLHARNLLGAHDYARLLADVIERRAADSAAAAGDDYLDLLTDPFTRALTGEDGYVTVLLEVRARNLLAETAWWTAVDDLRTGGHLAADRYGQLLDSLHARGLLDDLGSRRRRGHYPPAPSHEPLPRVAEPEADYHKGAPPKDGQTDLFE